jgi:hypothetical protein
MDRDARAQVTLVTTLGYDGQEVHEDGSNLALPAPKWSGAPLAPRNPRIPRITPPSAAAQPPEGDLGEIDDTPLSPKEEESKPRRTILVQVADGPPRRSMGEHDPLVQELLKCQQAEAVMQEEFAESFEELLTRERGSETSVRGPGSSSLRAQRQ